MSAMPAATSAELVETQAAATAAPEADAVPTAAVSVPEPEPEPEPEQGSEAVPGVAGLKPDESAATPESASEGEAGLPSDPLGDLDVHAIEPPLAEEAYESVKRARVKTMDFRSARSSLQSMLSPREEPESVQAEGAVAPALGLSSSDDEPAPEPEPEPEPENTQRELADVEAQPEAIKVPLAHSWLAHAPPPAPTHARAREHLTIVLHFFFRPPPSVPSQPRAAAATATTDPRTIEYILKSYTT